MVMGFKNLRQHLSENLFLLLLPTVIMEYYRVNNYHAPPFQ